MSKNVLETVLKVLLWGFLSIIVIIGVALSVVVWVLSPEKLTPIVEDAANDNVLDNFDQLFANYSPDTTCKIL